MEKHTRLDSDMRTRLHTGSQLEIDGLEQVASYYGAPYGVLLPKKQMAQGCQGWTGQVKPVESESNKRASRLFIWLWKQRLQSEISSWSKHAVRQGLARLVGRRVDIQLSQKQKKSHTSVDQLAHTALRNASCFCQNGVLGWDVSHPSVQARQDAWALPCLALLCFTLPWLEHEICTIIVGDMIKHANFLCNTTATHGLRCNRELLFSQYAC